MGFWAHLCAFALTLLNQGGPAAIFHEDSLDSPSPFFNGKNVDLAPTLPEYGGGNLATCPHNQYNFTYHTANTCNSPSNRQQWCQGTNILTDYEEVENVPNTGVTNKVCIVLPSSRAALLITS